MRFLRTKPTWAARRPEVVVALSGSFPGVVFSVSEEEAEPSIAWTDGPAEGSVSTALGQTPGWEVRSRTLGGDASPGASPLWLDRTLSVRALAVGVVRFQASGVRPYAGGDERARQRLWAILEEDDPATSGYPLTDAMATMLLESFPPGAEPGADELALRLSELGYDSLWSRAWACVDL